MPTSAYIAIGSNLGDRQSTIDSAIAAIERVQSTRINKVSSIIETPPVGEIEQGAYLNGVLRVQTQLDARELLDEMLRIESEHGRDREHEQRWGPRTLDLDLIVFGDQIIDESGLQVPHPRMHERSFVLIPLAEIAPDIEIPTHNETPRQMLEALDGAR